MKRKKGNRLKRFIGVLMAVIMSAGLLPGGLIAPAPVWASAVISYKNITNLVTNGNFETNVTGWTGYMTNNQNAQSALAPTRVAPLAPVHGETGTTGAAQMGTKTQGVVYIQPTTNLGAIPGHKYYIRSMVNLRGATAGVASVVTVVNAMDPATGANIVPARGTIAPTPLSSGLQTTATAGWQLIDAIWTADTANFNPRWIWQTTANQGNNDLYGQMDNVVIIDLTATFGAGNEPPLFAIREAVSSKDTAAYAQIGTLPPPNGHWDGSKNIIIPLAPEITTASIPVGLTGRNFSAQIEIEEFTGTMPFNYAISGLPLGSGLSISQTGLISGTVDLPEGQYSLTVTIGDAIGYQASRTFTLNVYEPPFINNEYIPGGVLGVPFSFTPDVTGSASGMSVSISVTGGMLPAGLSIIGNTITGTPTINNQSCEITITATNNYGSHIKVFTLGVYGAPHINTVSPLRNGALNVPYSLTLTASGIEPITWEHLSGNLPPGLSLDENGVLSGTPTSPGVYSFSVRASNEIGYDTVIYSLGIYQLPEITNTSFGKGRPGTFYSQLLMSTGSQPITYSITSGALPPGLILDPNTGIISGTPSATGTYTFTMVASNAAGNSAPKTLSITIDFSAIITTTSPLRVGTAGVNYGTLQFEAVGIDGSFPTTWSWSAQPGSSLPPGMTFNATTGVLSGTPTTQGTYNFYVTLSNNGDSTSPFSITIGSPPVITSAPVLFGGTDRPFTEVLQASGAGPITWTMTAGPTPAADIKLSSNGALSWLIPYVGEYRFTVVASNVFGNSAPVVMTLTITTPSITDVFLDNGIVGESYSHTFNASGVPPFTWSKLSGTLPPGLYWDAETATVSGVPNTTGTYNFRIRVDNVGGHAEENFSITVVARPTITTTALNSGNKNYFYSQSLAAGGTLPITWSVLPPSGDETGLPPGLSLAGNTISGIPANEGTYTFTVHAQNLTGSAYAATKQLTITIGPDGAPVITTGANLSAVKDSSITPITMSANNPTGSPLTWSLTSGSLPSGLSWNPATAAISGTPTVSGSYTFTITVENVYGTDSKTFIMNIPYVITFNANGGSGSMAAGAKIPGTSYLIPASGFTAPQNMRFAGWNTSGDGAGTAYGAGTFYYTDAAVTFYAIWEADTYTATVYLNLDGDHLDGETVELYHGGSLVTGMTGRGDGRYTATVYSGTYDIYIDGENTGKTITISGSANSVTLNYYSLTFSVTGDVPVSASGMPASPQKKLEGAAVSVAVYPTSADTTDPGGQPGIWDFNGWAVKSGGIVPVDGEFTMPANAVAFEGSWTFTEVNQYKVTYDIIGDAPDMFSGTIPGEISYYPGDVIEVTGDLTTTSVEKDGVLGLWSFDGWISYDVIIIGAGDTFTMPAKNVAVTGSWTFTPNASHEVSYRFTTAAPADVTAPSAAMHQQGSIVTVVSAPATAATTNGAGITGTWVFNGWTSGDVTITGAGDTFTMPGSDVEITGSWTFTPSNYNVTYTVTGDAPAAVSGMPVSPQSIAAGSLVTVAGNPTTASALKGGVAGTWAFNGWTTTDVSVSAGSFTMPSSAVAFTGSWTFTPNNYNVTYTVTGDAPATVSGMPISPQSIAAGSAVTVAGYPATTSALKGGVAGTWVFNGWTTTDVTVSAGSFTMPNGAVAFTGTWTFTPNNYNVTYTVTGDVPGTVSGMPVSPQSIAAGSAVTVAGYPTTTSALKGGVAGTWVFNGWTTTDAAVSAGSFTMPNGAVAFTGAWTFTPNSYDVTYSVTGDAPATASEMPEASVKTAGTSVLVENGLTTTETMKGSVLGTWVFDGWITEDADVEGGSFTMPNGNVTITGSWTFTPNASFNVTYTIDGEAPAGSAVPAEAEHQQGSAVTVAADLTTTETANETGQIGTWVFNGWTSDDVTITGAGGTFTMPGSDVEITGSWTFTEDGKYEVTYSVTGPAPAAFSGTIPAAASYYADAIVEVAAGLTATTNMNGSLRGTWTFSGWSTEDADVEDGSFTMPNDDVAFIGTWSFVEDTKYTVTYSVTGSAPATFSGTIPAAASSYSGISVNVAAGLTATTTMNGSLRGTWTFNGWTTEDAAVSGGRFTMPAGDVEFTGTWSFVEDTKYAITYSVTGPAPATFSGTIPGSASSYSGININVASGLTATTNMNGSLRGTWTFNGWTTEDASVSAGSFMMPAGDVAFTGTWSFVEDTKYAVTYSVTGPAPAAFSGTIPAAVSYYADAIVEVAAGLTATTTLNGAGVAGTWEFSGWATEDAAVSDGSFTMPAEAVAFTGSWTFTPSTYDVTYSVTGDAPATVSNMPVSPKTETAGTMVTVAAEPTTVSGSKDGVLGTWTFDGWTSEDVTIEGAGDSFTMPNGDVTITGSWTFAPNASFNVTYTIEGEAPEGSTVPAEAEHQQGSTVTVAAGLTSDSTTNSIGEIGTWSFDGWDRAGSFTMPGDDVVITGSWTFTEDGKYEVTYSVTGPAPAAFSGTIPAAASYYADTIVEVAAGLSATTNMNGSLRGTWTFDGWATEDADAEGGTFTMPNDEVAFTGTWSFVEDTKYAITYSVTGPAPATFSGTIPGSASSYSGISVNVASGLTATTTMNGSLRGTWTFNGWTTEDASVSAGSFMMPASDVAFTGTWSFVEDTKYAVTYSVTGPAPATFSGTIPAPASYYSGINVDVAAGLTSAATLNGAGIAGSWSFSGWSTADAEVEGSSFTMPAEAVAFTGSWTFTPNNYNVTYEVTGDEPATVNNMPSTPQSRSAGSLVTISADLTTEEDNKDGVAGTWEFLGWTSEDVDIDGAGDTFTMPNGPVAITGSWAFTPNTYYVTYAVEGGAPVNVENMPATPQGKAAGSSVAVAVYPTTEDTMNGDVRGTWTFNGWETEDAAVSGGSFTMPNGDVAFIGTWSFEEDGKHSVTYSVTGPAPAAFSGTIPAAISYYDGVIVEVAAGLTAATNMNGSLRGTWTFDGWTTEDAEVEDGSFTMPAEAVAFTGTWSFVEDTKYAVTYNVTGPAPASFSGTIPASANSYDGVNVSVAANLTTTETMNGTVAGSWSFNGWTTEDAEVEGGSFTMPAGDVAFTGTWSFTPNSYDVLYSITGTGPATVENMPTTPQSKEAGTTVNIADELTTEETVNSAGVAGTWSFNGWTVIGTTASDGSFTMPNGTVAVTGSWTFTPNNYNVTYTVTGDVPDTVSNMPASPQTAAAGSPVTVAAEPTTISGSKGTVLGTWTFDGWTSEDADIDGAGDTFTMPNGNVTITGSWTFTPNASYKVTYVIEGEAPEGSAVPAEAEHQQGSNVTVSAGLTTTETTNEAGQIGVWTFDGWDREGDFTMPDNDVTITGTWSFVEDGKYTVSYSVPGSAPVAFTGTIPSSVSYYADTIVDVADGLSTTATTNSIGQLGTWEFNGWTSEDVDMTGGSFTMPADDVAIIGSWTFTPNPSYEVSYVIDGDAPAGYTVPSAAMHQQGANVMVAGTQSTAETMKGTVAGSWSFNGWTTADAAISGGSFAMPGDDVVITGTWTFTPNKYDVTYSVTGTAPATASALPAANEEAAGSLAAVAGGLTTTETMNGAVAGSWSFNGWTTTDATVSGGSFTMPNNAVAFTGSWTFTPNTYNVTYSVSGPAPATASVMPAAQPELAGSTVTAAAGLTTTETMNGAGVAGTWEFAGWSRSSFTMPNEDVVITGTWTFTPNNYNVTYTVTGDAPATVSNMPSTPQTAAAGSPVTVAGNPTTTSGSKGTVLGTWTFDGWTSEDADIDGAGDTFTMPNGNVAITGSWTFTPNASYKVTYAIDGEAPEGATVPAEAEHQQGSNVTVAAGLTSGSTTNSAGEIGTWRFDGWDRSGSFTMPGEDVVITGSWTFTEDGKHEVTYSVTGDVPATFSGTIPAAANYYADIIVDVAPGLTATTNINGSLRGTWTFDGWTTADAVVEDGSFTMPNDDVAFIGTWSFVEDTKYAVTYSVTGSAPAAFSGTIPGSASYYSGISVDVMAGLTATTNMNGSLRGTWTFNGWTTEDAEVEDGEFTMPAKAVAFTGTWSFVEDTKYAVTYSVTGPAPATFSGTIPGPASYYSDVNVDVAAGLTATTNINGLLRGTWTFDGWTTEDATVIDGSFMMPADAVAFTGTWSFVEDTKYAVTYSVTGPAPALFSGTIPGSASYYDGVTVEVAAGLTATSTLNGAGIAGTWEFSGWTTEDAEVEGGSFTMPAEAVAFTGSWSFTPYNYTVTYMVTGDAPATVSNMPSTPQTIAAGSPVTVAGSPATTSGIKDGEFGTWAFDGWTTEDAEIEGGSFNMPNGNVVITGSWTFIPNGSHEVSYVIEGEAPEGSFAPENNYYQAEAAVTVAGDLTTTAETNNIGQYGTWAFDGWTSGNVEITGAGDTFTMPDEDVVITGSWTFTISTFDAELTVNLDHDEFTEHGKTFTLRKNDEVKAEGAGTDGTVVFSGLITGRYYVYDGDDNTGISIDVTNSNASATIDYYTVIFDAVPAGALTEASVYTTNGLESGSIVLSGTVVTFNAAGSGGPEETTVSYQWNDANMTANSGLTLEITEPTDVTCVVTGSIPTYKVTIYIYRDNSLCADHSVTLRQNGEIVQELDEISAGVHTAEVGNGTYEIYVNDEDTGKTITVTNREGNKRIDYFTVRFNATYNGLATGASISASNGMNSGDAVLSGTIVTFVALGQGPGGTGYTYMWNDPAVTRSSALTLEITRSTNVSSIVTGVEVRVDAAYRVEHFKLDAAGNATLHETVHLIGVIGTTVTAVEKTGYPGYSHLPGAKGEVLSGKVVSDGSLTLKVFYAPNKHTVSYVIEGDIPYGAPVAPAAVTNVSFGSAQTVAGDPAMDGYTFSGWRTSDVRIVDGRFTMPDEDVVFTGSWMPNEVTSIAGYTVEHYLVDASGNAVLQKTESFNGTIGTVAAAEPKTAPEFAGHTFNAGSSTVSGTIVRDGSLTLTLYYDIRTYSVSYSISGITPEGMSEVPASVQGVVPGTTVSVAGPVTTSSTSMGEETGTWTFSGWSRTGSFTMPSANVEITGIWLFTPDVDPEVDPEEDSEEDPVEIPPAKAFYRVKHILGGDVYETETFLGIAGETATAGHKDFYDYIPVGGGASGTITEDGSLVLELNYTKVQVSVGSSWISYVIDGYDPTGGALIPAVHSATHGSQTTRAANLTFEGYVFSGWTAPNASVDANGNFTVPNENVVFRGSWIECDFSRPVSYTVKHFLIALDADLEDPATFAEAELHEEETFMGLHRTQVTAVPKTGYAGYMHLQFNDGSDTGTLDKNGETLVLKLYYYPVVYSVSYMVESDSPVIPFAPLSPGEFEQVSFMKASFSVSSLTEFKPTEKRLPGQEVPVDINDTDIEGFVFSGWNTQDVKVDPGAPGSFVMPHGHVTFVGTWTPISDVLVHTVVFLNSDGAHLSTQHIPNGGDATAPAAPYRQGHTFTGWKGSYTNITGDTVIWASHTQNAQTAAVTPPPYDIISVYNMNHFLAGITAPSDPSDTENLDRPAGNYETNRPETTPEYTDNNDVPDTGINAAVNNNLIWLIILILAGGILLWILLKRRMNKRKEIMK